MTGTKLSDDAVVKRYLWDLDHPCPRLLVPGWLREILGLCRHGWFHRWTEVSVCGIGTRTCGKCGLVQEWRTRGFPVKITAWYDKEV